MTLDELIRSGRNFASVAETKAILEVDERTVYAGIERGEIQATRMGNRWKIPVAWLRKVAALDQQQESPASTEPVVTDELAAAVADRVVIQLARAFATLAAGGQEPMAGA